MAGIDGRIDEADPRRHGASARHRGTLGPADDIAREAIVCTARFGMGAIWPIKVVEVHRGSGRSTGHARARRFKRHATRNCQSHHIGAGYRNRPAISNRVSGRGKLGYRCIVEAKCYDLPRCLAIDLNHPRSKGSTPAGTIRPIPAPAVVRYAIAIDIIVVAIIGITGIAIVAAVTVVAAIAIIATVTATVVVVGQCNSDTEQPSVIRRHERHANTSAGQRQHKGNRKRS
ncbi:hypothetical protein GGQ99_004178 [Aminobacter niigataensis]|uniref:Uncharacterized protein n=1 Tax=Aminobacter niigataensis TaxID=83265 RepID=A0ABR6L6G6_9HYPH|nr:hypothetical protein [Aminobacter niigataensis]MBB4652402.1 hypothetical protein [Aminobacter niigataensis]